MSKPSSSRACSQASRIRPVSIVTVGISGPVAMRDVARHALPVRHVATPLRSYAGGTPAWCASCRRMIPSISASGRGGQKGT